jgi:hypothetical protein
MEVRRPVIVEEHRDRDPEEPTDRGHANHAAASRGWLRATAPVFRAGDKHEACVTGDLVESDAEPPLGKQLPDSSPG